MKRDDTSVGKTIAIVLNGASSSGKTSIARAIQHLSVTPVLHASLDTFTDMFHWAAIPDEEQKRSCHRAGVANFHRALPILAGCGFPVVIDHVFEESQWYLDCIEALKGTETHLIGVRCPLSELERRERTRPDRRGGLARFQIDRVHEGKVYALEVDTSIDSVDVCAEKVLARAGLPTRG
ncbi:MAG TPA: hypothetical protein VGM54_06095 [Chthoniobacter sp.]|jgi:chloramphenicol 3-O phosphotransferase